jgi:serine/threonine protein phosphatase 1
MQYSRRFVISDIHSQHSALIRLFRKAKFDYAKDLLINLGDIGDRGPKPRETVEELLKLKNHIFIRGNHDEWFIQYMNTGYLDVNSCWYNEGGKITYNQYSPIDNIPIEHKKLFESSTYYRIIDNMAFVHAGFRPGVHPKDESPFVLMYDYDLIKYVMNGNKGKIINRFLHGKHEHYKISEFDYVFVGHNPIQKYSPRARKPIIIENLVLMDCGAGYGQHLSMLNIDDFKEVYSVSIKKEN